MFPVCEFVKTKAFEFPPLSHWSHSFAVGIIVCFVFCVIWFLYFYIFAFCIYADKGLWLCFPQSSIPLYQGTLETAWHWGLNSQQSLWNTKATVQIRRYKYKCTNNTDTMTFWNNPHLCRTLEIACHWPQRSIFMSSEDSWLSTSSLSKSRWPIVTRSDQKTNCDGDCHVRIPGPVTAVAPNHVLWWKLLLLETTLKVKSWLLRCPPDNMLGEGAVNVEGGGGGGGWRKRFNYTRESDLLVSADMVIAQSQKYKYKYNNKYK